MLYEKALAFVLALFTAMGGGLSGAANVTVGDVSFGAPCELRDTIEKRLSVPIIDGAEITEELTAAFVSGYTGISYETVLGDTVHSGTDAAFERLFSGEVDIVIDTYLRPRMVDGFIENYFEYPFETVATRAFDVIDPPEEYTYYEYYRVFYDKNKADQNVVDFIKFTLSDKGQASVYQSDFEPIREIDLPFVEKPPYETLGTGDPRPENFEKSKKFSALSFGRSNYSADDLHKTHYFLLNNDLTNKKLEDEINEWIVEEITTKNLTHKYICCVVYFQAINGYLEVVISQTPGEGGYYMPDSPVSVWNLKTGERVTEFSDLFYEGEDFLTALEETYKAVFPDKLSIDLTIEPERFFITDFLFGDSDYRYIDEEYGGETIEDEYKLPINFLSPVMDYSPVWTYCDLTPYFTARHLDLENWRHVKDNALPDFGVKASIYNGIFREWEIVSSRFLSDEEIETRNSELRKLYNFIENSGKIKYAKPEYEWQKIINSTVEFSKNGEIAVIYTPFGDFVRNCETGEMLGPDDDIRLNSNENFIGRVDVDFDGKAEWIAIYNGIRIYDENLKYVTRIPIENNYNYLNIIKWEVIKGDEADNTTGRIYYDNYYENGVITYEIVNGKIKKNSETPNIQNEYTITANSVGRGLICYTGSALDMNTADLFSDDFKKNQRNFQTQIKRAEDLVAADEHSYGLFTAIDFGDGHNAVFTRDKYFYDGKEITSEDYYAEGIEVAFVGDIVLVVTENSGQRSRSFVMQYAEEKFTESPISSLPIGDIKINNNKIEFETLTWDEYTVDDYLTSSNAFGTFKKYWFFVSGSRIYEYGAVSMPIDEFKKLRGAKAALDEIAAENGKVTEILFRGNGIININYDIVYEDKPDEIYHFHKTYELPITYNWADEIVLSKIKRIKDDSFTENENGIYLPSFIDYSSAENETYSEPVRLQILKNRGDYNAVYRARLPEPE
jgi:hypothetical protein